MNSYKDINCFTLSRQTCYIYLKIYSVLWILQSSLISYLYDYCSFNSFVIFIWHKHHKFRYSGCEIYSLFSMRVWFMFVICKWFSWFIFSNTESVLYFFLSCKTPPAVSNWITLKQADWHTLGYYDPNVMANMLANVLESCVSLTWKMFFTSSSLTCVGHKLASVSFLQYILGTNDGLRSRGLHRSNQKRPLKNLPKHNVH